MRLIKTHSLVLVQLFESQNICATDRQIYHYCCSLWNKVISLKNDSLLWPYWSASWKSWILVIMNHKFYIKKTKKLFFEYILSVVDWSKLMPSNHVVCVWCSQRLIEPGKIKERYTEKPLFSCTVWFYWIHMNNKVKLLWFELVERQPYIHAFIEHIQPLSHFIYKTRDKMTNVGVEHLVCVWLALLIT